MRILIHDFGGYAFPLQLSRQLARRGHDVAHAYCATLVTTPPGVAHDPGSVALKPLHTKRPFDKYNLIRRWQQEHEYGHLIRETCRTFAPEVVLSGNAPLPAQNRLLKYCRQQNIRFIFWLQDLLGVAAAGILKSRHWVLGTTVGRYMEALERKMLRSSAAVVSICGDFVPLLAAMGIKKGRIHVVENWGLLPNITGHDDGWAIAHGLEGRFVFLYTGTLSLKHNPDLLLQLACATRSAAQVVVISQGMGADWLTAKKAELGLANLTILPYQDSDDLPFVYASADVLTALLTRDAGVFSVPSKILTYLCAARPVLAAMPSDNLAARILLRSGAGRVTPAGDVEAFVDQALQLMQDAAVRASMGAAGRIYAEEHFDIEQITDRFEEVFAEVVR
ncbi:MAG: glycosyltransferase family 4 protein [Bacteroidota bacterium]|nr:glycosyltransferase family 4 protein [Bacteroidota bacterium]